ncbi:sensor histidine kinase [Paenibacillus daejeonensis]|uniref:sensor histidine kinase n=1 Tax=Paenibacillus daejeonensis TaxID=135193 RepID=UPI00035FE308|nr:sensor histidine kinase [Paenibacillus daejeonensis]
MKLFWRDQVSIILGTVIQLMLVVLVFYLDGYRSLTIPAYALLLGLLACSGLLVYRWISHRRLYRLLSDDQPNEYRTLEPMDMSAVPQAVQVLLEKQHRHYMQRVQQLENQQAQHLSFMQLWVHQMKTPLSVLDLMLQDSGEARDESMREETERLKSGLEMVMYMARLQTFEQDFYIERVTLREVVNEVILEHKRLLIRSALYPQLAVDEALQVETDRKWLRFVLQQLITNAAKYGASGGKLAIRAYTSGRAVYLEVEDGGVGIPAADQGRIFRPFFTGENGRAFKESTGMGLYIVSSVLERMGHHIEVESVEQQGTRMRVIFPHGAKSTWKR